MDVFEQVRPEDSLNDIDYAKTFSSFNKPVAIKGVKGEILYMNELAKNLSRLSDREIFASYDEKLPEDIAQVNALGLLSIEKKIELKTPGGGMEEKFFHIESKTLLNKFGLFYGTMFIFYDFTLFVKYVLDIKNNSENKVYDEITGLFLKNQFKEMLSREVERVIRYGFPLTLAVFFFENLVFFGQSFGKDKLNQLLKFYGIFFRQKFRKTDTLFRIDFNNFICILPHTNYESANNKFRKLQKELDEVIKFQNNIKPILIFGISEFDLKRHYKNYELLIEEARVNQQNNKFCK
ncbi:MAG: diguanylate cyclase [Deltaproteobacteria bacterium]|jgi:diguanylate cyclase (GGDEF)-like protein|nr:diguanylate cyclase [Deltaproteobacteria bacterium]